MGNKPYRDRETLENLYHDKGMSIYDIGDKFTVSGNTISVWMQKLDVPRREAVAAELTDETWLRDQYHNLGLSTTEIADKLDCTHRTVINWMEKHGIKRRPAKTRPDELSDKESLKELYVERDLSGHEIADRLDVDQKTVYRWLNKHDIDTTREYRSGEDHPSHKDGHRDYGSGWYAKRREVRERDGACQGCGISREQCKEQYGEDLHVHHVMPARKLDPDSDLLNSDENLVALCRDCHARWEGVPVKPVLTD